MLERAIDRYADVVTRRRKLVIAITLVAVAVCASQLPRLRVDSAPEELMISRASYRDEARAFRERFGNTDSVVALLVGADDVTALAPLGYVHALSRHFASDPRVVRVLSITVTPLPGAPQPETEETLADLDAPEEAQAPSPRVEAALETLIATDPPAFPMGLLSVVERMGDGSADVRGVVRGDAPTEAEADAIRVALDDAPLVVGRLVSRDRRLAAVVLFLDPAIGTGEARIGVVHEMDAWLAAHPPPSGVTLNVAGIPHLRAAIRDAMLADQLFLVPIALVVCIALLYASFRWAAGVILPITMVAFSVIGVLGGMAILGEPLSILMNTLPTLLVIMGIAEAVHVVGRYVEEARRTNDRIEASRRALRSLMIACFLTSFTTSVGFGALVVAQTEMLRHFGVAAALGVMVSYVLLITFVPAALSFFPPPRTAKDPDAPRAGRLEAILVLATARIARRPWPVILATALLVLPSVWAYASIHVDTALLETFDRDDPVAVSTRLVERNLDGILPLEIHVHSERDVDVRDPALLAALDRIATWARAEPGVLRVTTPGDLLWEPWRRIDGIPGDAPHEPFRSRAQVDALITLLDRLQPNPIREWITDDGRDARVEVRLADVGAVRSVALIHDVEEHARTELAPFAGVDVALVGEAFIGAYGVTSVVQDLFGSLTLSAIVIFALIGLLFRSARLGLLAIPPNVIPQIGTVGWMVLRGIPLNAGTAIVFSVAIGVSVDLTIHGFARLVEEERRGLSRRAAIVRVARSTGRAVVVSCATLVIGFSVLMWSGFVPVRHFGELIAVALASSLAATLVFQPAMMALRRRPIADVTNRPRGPS